MELELNNSGTTQVHVQGSELIRPSIYTIYDLLECVNDSHSMTCGHSWISERSFSDGPVLMEYQKPKTLNQTNYSLQ